MLDQQAIRKFKNIYFMEYGKELSFEDAAAKAESLLRLYKAVLKPSNYKGPSHGSKNNTSSTKQ